MKKLFPAFQGVLQYKFLSKQAQKKGEELAKQIALVEKAGDELDEIITAIKTSEPSETTLKQAGQARDAKFKLMLAELQTRKDIDSFLHDIKSLAKIESSKEWAKYEAVKTSISDKLKSIGFEEEASKINPHLHPSVRQAFVAKEDAHQVVQSVLPNYIQQNQLAMNEVATELEKQKNKMINL